MVFSWFSIMAAAGGAGYQDAHLYIWGIFEKYVVPAAGSVLGTMEVFWKIMKWSFFSIGFRKISHVGLARPTISSGVKGSKKRRQ